MRLSLDGSESRRQTRSGAAGRPIEEPDPEAFNAPASRTVRRRELTHAL
jgi:hypothetical protein